MSCVYKHIMLYCYKQMMLCIQAYCAMTRFHRPSQPVTGPRRSEAQPPHNAQMAPDTVLYHSRLQLASGLRFEAFVRNGRTASWTDWRFRGDSFSERPFAPVREPISRQTGLSLYGRPTSLNANGCPISGPSRSLRQVQPACHVGAANRTEQTRYTLDRRKKNCGF